MAITRAQQFRQMLEDGGMLVKPGRGKRPGYRGDAAYGERDKDDKVKDTFAAGDGFDRGKFQEAVVRGKVKPLIERDEEEKGRGIDPKTKLSRANLESIQSLGLRKSNFPGLGGMALNALLPFRRFTLEKNKDYFIGLKSRGAAKNYAATADGYKQYMTDRLAGKIDAAGNPLNQGDDDDSQLLIAQAVNPDQATTPTEETTTDPAFFRLLADGGRAGIMNGGRIGFKGGADMATVAGDTTPARKGSVNISSSGGVTFDPSGRDDRPDDRSNLVQNVTQQLVREGVEPKEIRRLTNNQTFLDKFGPAILKAGAFATFNPVVATIGGQAITLDQAIGAGTVGKNIVDLYKGKQGIPAGLTEEEKDLERLLKTKGLGTETDETQLGTGDILTGPVDITDPNFEKAAGSIKRFKDAVDSEGNKMFSVDDIIDSKQDVENIKNLSDEQIRSIFDQVRLPTGDFNRRPAAEGGIMDLETGRQMYFLGKLVKKATRAVKKIVKSPIGKAALLGFGANALMSGGLGAFLKTKAAPFLFKEGANFAAGNVGLGKLLSGGLTGGGMLALGGALTAAPLLFGKQEEDDDTIDPSMLGPNIDIAKLLANPYLATLGTGFRRTAADGGRIGYQEGSKEPVAKKTMPLLDMGGQEMDLRDNGGFVPIGRMEKADDVPARLSKNEFVFTADAVRNAGDGDIDKGAEVMYNMMKNLEDGGNVSEESQGLEGARNMFQTAQRLEEVL